MSEQQSDKPDHEAAIRHAASCGMDALLTMALAKAADLERVERELEESRQQTARVMAHCTMHHETVSATTERPKWFHEAPLWAQHIVELLERPADAVALSTTWTSEVEHLRMQIGYIVTELMVRGDPRSLPEIVETAAKATAPRSASGTRTDG